MLKITFLYCYYLFFFRTTLAKKCRKSVRTCPVKKTPHPHYKKNITERNGQSNNVDDNNEKASSVGPVKFVR